ncbi:MAG: ATPase, partial [Acetatifactor sp.]|nr:ATPase [Acetatifactor sp.]
MVERMKYLNITGPKADMDRMIKTYLSKYEMHLENAMNELSKVQEVRPFVETSPYREVLFRAEALLEKLPEKKYTGDKEMTDEEATAVIDRTLKRIEELVQEQTQLKEEKRALSREISQMEPFRMLNYDLRKIQDFKYIKFRFGRMPLDYFQKFTVYAEPELEAIFHECGRDEDYVWGIYFVPAAAASRVDAVFSTLHFEKEVLPDNLEGTPEEAYQEELKKLRKLRSRSKKIREKISEILNENAEEILCACYSLKKQAENFEVRKMAACSNDEATGQVFYILCGWMTADDARAFLQDIESDDNVYCIMQGSKDSGIEKPPTKLKNPKLFRPFEMFVSMYGLPAYNEMDPTVFIGLTYSLMFGIMFGDAGQGLLLAIGGYLLYKRKNMTLGGIVAMAGTISTIFGLLYGSVFGFEELIPALWRRPSEDIMTTLYMAIAFGMGLIVIAMIIHIVNAVRVHSFEQAVLDPSGIAGLVVYASAAASVVLIYTGHKAPGAAILGVLVGVPLLAIFLKEPLANLLERKKKLFPKGSKAMFFVESFVELFDVVLSYATNTISFVRVGAFALSHAGMMGVVMTLAGLESGHPNFIDIILGNLLVTGLEGLVVGIQVLRLEYYEMFSRFYSGTGRA